MWTTLLPLSMCGVQGVVVALPVRCCFRLNSKPTFGRRPREIYSCPSPPRQRRREEDKEGFKNCWRIKGEQEGRPSLPSSWQSGFRPPRQGLSLLGQAAQAQPSLRGPGPKPHPSGRWAGRITPHPVASTSLAAAAGEQVWHWQGRPSPSGLLGSACPPA